MSAKLLDSLGGKLAEKWVATLLTPAFIFWADKSLGAVAPAGSTLRLAGLSVGDRGCSSVWRTNRRQL